MPSNALVRSYGGRRIGLEKPTPEQIAHAGRVDEILRRILAPEVDATVLQFPERRPPESTEMEAA